jgi:hypothetical protein
MKIKYDRFDEKFLNGGRSFTKGMRNLDGRNSIIFGKMIQRTKMIGLI